MRFLVTGATGKVGQAFVARLLADKRWPTATVRALCPNRTLPGADRLETVHGSISDRDVVARAMQDVTHVVHMATVKEDPQLAMDVSADQVKAKLDSKELVIIAGDTLPPQIQAFKEGRSHAQIGQRPHQMGNEAPDVLIKLINGESVEDPIYTGLDICSGEDAGTCQ